MMIFLLLLFFLSADSTRVQTMSFSDVSILTLDTPYVFTIQHDSIFITSETQHYYTSFKEMTVTKVSDVRLLTSKMSVDSTALLLISNYLGAPKAHWANLKELRSYTHLNDFMYYFGALERFDFKEYHKALFNFRKAKELGLHSLEIEEKIAFISTLLNQPYTKNKTAKSFIKDSLIRFPEPQNAEKPLTISEPQIENYLSWMIASGIILIFIGSFVFIRKLSSPKPVKNKENEKKVFREKFDEEYNLQTPKKENEVIQPKPVDDSDIQQRKENLISMIQKKQQQEEYLEEEEDYDYDDDEEEKPQIRPEPSISKNLLRDSIETEHLNLNSGEVELALNLHSIKRKNTSTNKKYTRINELRQKNMSVDDIARELNITISEVELFLSFKK